MWVDMEYVRALRALIWYQTAKVLDCCHAGSVLPYPALAQLRLTSPPSATMTIRSHYFTAMVVATSAMWMWCSVICSRFIRISRPVAFALRAQHGKYFSQIGL